MVQHILHLGHFFKNSVYGSTHPTFKVLESKLNSLPLFLFCFIFPDALVRKLEELEKTADMYRGLMSHSHRLLKGFFDLSQAHHGQF